MPNVRFKVRTQRRPAQFSRVAIASQKDNRIETCTVGGLLFVGEKTVLPGPKNLNPISSSKCIALAPHAKVLRTTVQY